ncbi:hypothetical protein A0U91_00235 [Acetobacter persici]|uniref:Uncharacterized protein n=1 Tax=Acetobacter persici TaxID=1076596 RepID=A0A1U9LBF3_9PROT|nr:hypothetical protein A0U91_00235 [Acetobacter persici]
MLGQSASTGIKASASTILATALDEYTITNAASQWGIFTASNQPVLTSSHVRALEMRREEIVTDAPIEEGGFMSYNKVTRPAQIRLQIICDGSSFSYGDATAVTDVLAGLGLGVTSSGLSVRAAFTKALDSLVADLNQYHVATPEKTYLNMNVVGYPSGAIVSGSAVGTFWISTADNNVTVPGATGATWKSLFDGYATQDWANSWFVKNLGGAAGVLGATMDSTTGQPTFQDGSGNWHQMQVYGQCPKFSDFVSGWGQNGYIEIPTSGNWKLVVQWVQFQGVTGTGGNNGAGRYETADIFVTWPFGMGNLLSIPGLAVEDVGGVGMQEQVWKMADPTATSGSFRLACNASGITMTGSAWIIGSIAA